MAEDQSYSIVEFVEDQEAGIRLTVERTDEYLKLMQTFHAEECRHPEKIPMRVKIANGAVHVRDCCISCGERVGSAKSQSDKQWVETLPWQPETLSGDYKKRRDNQRQEIMLELARKQYAERGRLTKKYNEHIASAKWRATRDLIFKRCGEVCEGCGVASATQVHHLTYRHLGNEFLFELLGLCRSCHEQIESEKRGRQVSDNAWDEEELEPED